VRVSVSNEMRREVKTNQRVCTTWCWQNLSSFRLHCLLHSWSWHTSINGYTRPLPLLTVVVTPCGLMLLQYFHITSCLVIYHISYHTLYRIISYIVSYCIIYHITDLKREKPRFELVVKGLLRLGRCYRFLSPVQVNWGCLLTTEIN